MKFKFCWDGDCPDWLLAEIARLAAISCKNLQLLVQHVVATLVNAEAFDREKAEVWTSLTGIELDACIGGLRWIIEMAAGANVSSYVLQSELEQLGLAKDLAVALTEEYSKKQEHIHHRLSRPKGINCYSGNVNFDVDVKGLQIAGEIEPILQLTIHRENESINKLSMSSEHLKVLIQELNEARQMMASLM